MKRDCIFYLEGRWKRLLTCLLLIGCNQSEKVRTVSEPVLSAGQHSQSFSKTVSKILGCRYLLFLPEGDGRKEQKWPMIMFLHGAGQSGDDVNKVKELGPPRIVERQKEFHFILISPLCPKDQWWYDKIELLISLLDDVVSRYDVDTERIYLTGLSIGGYGTWDLAGAYPDRFAAIAPVCGGGSRAIAYRSRNIPVWAFHGAKDQVVPLKESEDVIAAVKDFGGDAKLTVYPDVGHDAWTQTYENQELYDWFLKHRKNSETE